jgi:transcriptional regulator with XRE-family HTH domain
MTQETLAETADLDRTYPSLLERGLRQPTLAYLFALADALKMSAADLVAQTCTELQKRLDAERDRPTPANLNGQIDRR